MKLNITIFFFAVVLSNSVWSMSESEKPGLRIHALVRTKSCDLKKDKMAAVDNPVLPTALALASRKGSSPRGTPSGSPRNETRARTSSLSLSTHVEQPCITLTSDCTK